MIARYKNMLEEGMQQYAFLRILYRYSNKSIVDMDTDTHIVFEYKTQVE